MREETELSFVDKLSEVQFQHEGEHTFGQIALLWSGFLDIDISEHDVAMMMCLLKIGRTRHPSYRLSLDTYVDMANYANLAYELAWEEEHEPNSAKG